MKGRNLATVSGVEAAIQSLSTVLGTIKGECIYDINYGSLVSDYYGQYKDNLELLSRLIN